MGWRIAAVVGVVVALGSCVQREPAGLGVPGGSTTLFLKASLTGTAVATVVVDVTAPDITTPLVFNISVTNGVAAGSITIPAGSHRTIDLRAYDGGGVETHSGSVTLDIQPGTNPTISILLIPLTSELPITVTLGSFSVTVRPSTALMTPGDTVTLTATVLDPTSTPVTDQVVWATLNPAVATVVSTGQQSGRVTATGVGLTSVVAIYGGVAGQVEITATTEPIYNPSVNTSLFYDDFEAYGATPDLTSGQNAKYWLQSGNVALVNTPGADFAGGAQFARFDYSAPGDYANELYTNQHNNPILDTASVVLVTYGFRDIGAFYTGKEFIVRDVEGLNRFVLISFGYVITPQSLQNCWYDAGYQPLTASVPPLATTPTWSRDGLESIGGPSPHFLGGNMGYPAAQFLQAGTLVGQKNDGRWHRFTYRFTKERLGRGTGRLEGWYDGVKFMEYIGDDPNRCEYGQVWTWDSTNTIWNGDAIFVGTTSGGQDWGGGALVDMDGVRVWVP